MEKDRLTTVSEAVYKIQLALLNGIKDDNHLFAAGSLMSKGDYYDVVTERTISKLCGYPLCTSSLPSEQAKKGRYHISMKEHRVFDLNEISMYCSSNCLINSKAFWGSLKEERYSDLNPVKVKEILSLFENVGLEDEENEEKGKNSAKLVIVEKTSAADGGEVSMEEWIGPSNAIEGYVPHRDRRKGNEHGNAKLNNHDLARNDFDVSVKSNEGANDFREVVNNGKSNQLNNSEIKGSLLNDMNFTSVIMTPDEYNGMNVLDGSSTSGQSKFRKGSKAKNSESKGKEPFFGFEDFSSVIITQEYSVSKLPSSQVIPDPNQLSQEFSERLDLGDIKKSSEHSEITVCSSEKGPHISLDSVGGTGNYAGQNRSSTEDCFQSDQNDAISSSSYVKDDSHVEKMCYSSQLKGKSSLRTSGVKKLARSVTWADEKSKGLPGRNLCEFSDSTKAKEGRSVTWADKKVNGLPSGNLCEFSDYTNTKKDPGTSGSKETGENDDSQRFASAEACAMALMEAAEAVASGQFDANDAVSKAGITVLPQPKITDEGERSGADDALEDVASEKWPSKPGNINSEFFDSNNSWFDSVPEGFSLTLSPFALMWNALFSWLTSSSLAYIYGREESFHEEYLSVNGREYPARVVLPDGRSPEIQQTLSGCLTRALPQLIADLKLSTPVSTIEKGVNCLLDTMSFMDSLPPFRMKQWQVIALLFIDALSVCRIPGLTAHLTSRRILFAKVLNGAQISAEEYDIMKDLVIPLGRVPQFSMQSGG